VSGFFSDDSELISEKKSTRIVPSAVSEHTLRLGLLMTDSFGFVFDLDCLIGLPCCVATHGPVRSFVHVRVNVKQIQRQIFQ
jgi:hypothetical protein